MFFKNRSFNVKLVKDDIVDTEIKDPMQGVLVAQAYATVAEEFVKGVSEAVIAVVVAKTACKVIETGAKALVR